jgi:UDP-N-acetylmuramoyl-L-alanyl-D-glutamate--2,6-diaminopimelate ligase
MQLKELIEDIEAIRIDGRTDAEIRGITFDSRQVRKDYVFVAVRGTGADGHDYIPQALGSGASAIVAETVSGKDPGSDASPAAWIRVVNSRLALALMASAWYGHPSRDLHLVGITGTNGKTTVATLLHRIHTSLGFRSGLLSTIQVLVGEESHPATHTTPDPLQINGYLRDMVEAGCGTCFMEVSSHAIDQERTAGLDFNGGVFTNLSRDHLDYHGDFRTYLEVKKRFFDQLSQEAFALVNVDDRNGQVMLQNCRAARYTYSLRSVCDFRGKITEMHLEGSSLEIGGSEVWVRLPGRFNASNLLCVYATGILSGQDPAEMLTALSRVELRGSWTMPIPLMPSPRYWRPSGKSMYRTAR